MKKTINSTHCKHHQPNRKLFNGQAPYPKHALEKTMHRILRKIACDKLESISGTSALADPSVVDELIEGRMI